MGRLLDCFLLSFSFSYYYSLVSFDLLSLVHIFLCPPAIGDDLGTAARTKRWGFLRNREGASHDMEVVGEDKWKGAETGGGILVYPCFPTTGRTGRWGGLGPATQSRIYENHENQDLKRTNEATKQQRARALRYEKTHTTSKLFAWEATCG